MLPQEDTMVGMTLKALVDERKAALEKIDLTAEKECAAIRERASREKATIQAELAEVGITLVNGAPKGRRRAQTHDMSGNPPLTLRDQVYSVLRTAPHSRQQILMAFKGWRPGSIDNTLAALQRQGKIARVGVGQYAAVAQRAH